MTTQQLRELARQNLSLTAMKQILAEHDITPAAGREVETLVELIEFDEISLSVITSPRTRDLTHEDRRFLGSLKKHFHAIGCGMLDDLFGTRLRPAANALIEVHGYHLFDMYDDAPGLACFRSNTSCLASVAPYTSEDSLRDLALAEFNKYRTDEDWYDGMFVAESVRILNSEEEVIDLFERGCWFDGFIPSDQWPEVEARIEENLREARLDSRWDNHDSARRQYEQAERLETILAMSRRHASTRLQQTA